MEIKKFDIVGQSVCGKRYMILSNLAKIKYIMDKACYTGSSMVVSDGEETLKINIDELRNIKQYLLDTSELYKLLEESEIIAYTKKLPNEK